MSEERTVIQGFRRAEEEPHMYDEEHFIPVDDEPDEGINLTWVLWVFAIAIFLILGITTASLSINISNYNKIKQIEQTINNEERGS